MKWTEITVLTVPEAEETVSSVLLDAGAKGVNIKGYVEKGKQQSDDEAGKAAISEPFAVSAYFPADGSDKKALSEINKEIENLKKTDPPISLGTLEVLTSETDEKDWENEWKKYFKPVQVSDFFVIKPTWENYKPRSDWEHIIEIDPGMAFGTGTHESTKMCIKMLEEFVDENMTVIDVGTGSGILSIAALMLGAKKVYSLDNDSVAVEVAKSNIELNGVSERSEVIKSDLLNDFVADIRADVVVANIIADVIIKLTPDVTKYIKKNGMFICSGIIETRAAEVQTALESYGFRIIQIQSDGEWRAIAAKYKVK